MRQVKRFVEFRQACPLSADGSNQFHEELGLVRVEHVHGSRCSRLDCCCQSHAVHLYSNGSVLTLPRCFSYRLVCPIEGGVVGVLIAIVPLTVYFQAETPNEDKHRRGQHPGLLEAGRGARVLRPHGMIQTVPKPRNGRKAGPGIPPAPTKE